LGFLVGSERYTFARYDSFESGQCSFVLCTLHKMKTMKHHFTQRKVQLVSNYASRRC